MSWINYLARGMEGRTFPLRFRTLASGLETVFCILVVLHFTVLLVERSALQILAYGKLSHEHCESGRICNVFLDLAFSLMVPNSRRTINI